VKLCVTTTTTTISQLVNIVVEKRI
jgi:hypothetical protein